jgi:hypothetical protein
MNQTESGRKTEGSGVGILSDARPATSARSDASAIDSPWLWLHAYLTAPDTPCVEPGSLRDNNADRPAERSPIRK